MKNDPRIKTLFIKYIASKNLLPNLINLLVNGKIKEIFFNEIDPASWLMHISQYDHHFLPYTIPSIKIGHYILPLFAENENKDTWEKRLQSFYNLTNPKNFSTRPLKKVKKEKTNAEHITQSKYYNKFNNLKSQNYARNNFWSSRRLSRR